jgi:hypothetical protein
MRNYYWGEMNHCISEGLTSFAMENLGTNIWRELLVGTPYAAHIEI